MTDTNQYLLVNQKTKICTHSKEILIRVQDKFVAIVCEKCKIMWSLDGDE